ncbi:hypothetical protein [Chromobacterium subtsugae]|uniref:hypothetical protein n=1 Tax=Chromobacterium subtsugae TaxID=251747 RepID=UPI0007F87D6C|nr:hypothetical protein [Chromobacterium subtsugae]OBU85498.1 hypothetical protein MY55_16120 [Chromobacterium subtsugae]
MSASNPTPADLAASLAQLLQKYNVTMDQFNAWLTSAGMVTLTDAAGGTHTVPSAANVLRADGSNASGTWPISVSGNAGSVSSVTAAQVAAGLGYQPVRQDSIPDTKGAMSYVQLGTFTCGQNGAKLALSVVFGNGYNAANSQLGMATLIFSTSNGGAQQPGSAGPFFGAATAMVFGNSGCTFLIAQNSPTSYTVFVQLQAWAGAGGCSAFGDASNGGWVASVVNTGSKLPAGNLLTVQPQGILTVSSFNTTPTPAPAYTRATAPAAAAYAGALVYITDATGGAALAWSNGNAWISVRTGNPV